MRRRHAGAYGAPFLFSSSTQLTFAITADGDVRDVKFKYKKFSSTRFLILILRVLTPEYLLTDRRTRVTKFSTQVTKFSTRGTKFSTRVTKFSTRVTKFSTLEYY